MKIFERPGPANTEELLEIMRSAAADYEQIVVASITGNSAVKAAEMMRDKQIICVTCPQGMGWEVDHMDSGPFAEIPELRRIRSDWQERNLKRVPMEISPENRQRLDRLGVKVVRGTIPFFGPTFSMRIHLRKVTELDLVAKTLELFSTGTLVCLECVLMAVDAGMVPDGSKVIAAAGTELGLDTAWVIRASTSAGLFHPSKGARFIEPLAKPAIPLVPDVSIDYLR